MPPDERHPLAVTSPPTFGRFFLPGPTEVHPDVLSAMVRPVIGHRGPEMAELLAAVGPTLRGLFGTERPVHVATSSATGLMEAAVRNLVGRRALCLVCGAFGARFYDIAERCGRPADRLDVAWGERNAPEALGEALRRADGRYDVVTVVHSETSTGVLNPVAELAGVVREFPDVLLVVDGVSSVAGTAIEADAWGVDFLLTGSQKALALPPGLAFAVASERALERARSLPARSYYFDLLELDRRALADSTVTTPAVTLLYALRRQAERIEAEGLAARFARHAAMARRTAAWVEDLAARTGEPFRVVAPDGYRSPTVTAIGLPAGRSGPELAAALAADGFTIAPGYGRMKHDTIRIGHMGDHTPAELDALLDALDAVVAAGPGGRGG